MRILLVDDDEDDIHLSQFAFQRLKLKNHSLEFVTSGQKLMDLLLQANCEFPDLILLDLNMPKMSGFEILAEIKSSPTLKYLPIIIFSTSDSHKDIDEAIRLGAKDYIIKPAGLNNLMEAFRKILSTI